MRHDAAEEKEPARCPQRLAESVAICACRHFIAPGVTPPERRKIFSATTAGALVRNVRAFNALRVLAGAAASPEARRARSFARYPPTSSRAVFIAVSCLKMPLKDPVAARSARQHTQIVFRCATSVQRIQSAAHGSWCRLTHTRRRAIAASTPEGSSAECRGSASLSRCSPRLPQRQRVPAAALATPRSSCCPRQAAPRSRVPSYKSSYVRRHCAYGRPNRQPFRLKASAFICTREYRGMRQRQRHLLPACGAGVQQRTHAMRGVRRMPPGAREMPNFADRKGVEGLRTARVPPAVRFRSRSTSAPVKHEGDR
jgi:hypothetical protein